MIKKGGWGKCIGLGNGEGELTNEASCIGTAQLVAVYNN